MNRHKVALLVVLALVALDAMAQNGAPEVPRPQLRTLSREFSNQQILEALAEGYPGHIEITSDGLDVRGTTIIWADGRALTSEQMAEQDRYASYGFYTYLTGTLPPVVELTAEEAATIDAFVDYRDRNPIERSPALFMALYGITDRASAEARMQWIPFLGKYARIHGDLADVFARVDARVSAALETDSELKRFLDSLSLVDGFNFRQIAGTETLSLHSYGIAVDLIPRSYGGQPVYWRWTRDYRDDWYAVSYADRFLIPESLVAAFEAEGFVWGGKWFFYDTIHFEYRPELMILNQRAFEREVAEMARRTPEFP